MWPRVVLRKYRLIELAPVVSSCLGTRKFLFFRKRFFIRHLLRQCHLAIHGRAPPYSELNLSGGLLVVSRCLLRHHE